MAMRDWLQLVISLGGVLVMVGMYYQSQKDAIRRIAALETGTIARDIHRLEIETLKTADARIEDDLRATERRLTTDIERVGERTSKVDHRVRNLEQTRLGPPPATFGG
jgi:hypothetical protein